ncbi:MAG: M57 family metalloprotease [Bacteroidota bacterium]
MKNTIRRSALLLCAFSFLFAFNACQKEADVQQDLTTHEHHEHNSELDITTIPDDQISQAKEAEEHHDALLKHIDDMAINLEDVERIDFPLPDGTMEERFLVEGCIAMTEEELHGHIMAAGDNTRQYRTRNLVTPRTLTVIGYTAGSFGLTSKMQTALRWAVANYNRLGLTINFSLSFSGSTNADIVVYQNTLNSGAGGQAGFPSLGNPFKWVQIFSGMESRSTNVNEHVITHEIGHCIGLRHTDYFSRASCGQNVNEGDGGVGAIPIAGTPTGIDWESVMLACFNNNEDGEFGGFDVTALRAVY